MGVILPYIEIIALESIGKERYGKVRLWGSIGFSVVAFILGKSLNSPEVAILYLFLTAFFTAIFAYMLSFYNRDVKEESADENREFSLIRYWALWVSIFLFQFSFGGFYNFFTIYETSSGMALDSVSYLWIFGVICEIIMLQFQGPLLAKYNLLTLINISIVSAIFRWILTALYPTDLTAILIAQATHALSFALYYSAIIAYIYRLYPQKKLAQQFLLGIGFGLGGALGAIVAGFIYKHFPSGLFLFESFVALLASIALIIHKKRVERINNG
jgi:PPP family 3-phenylpropionic acid transporter